MNAKLLIFTKPKANGQEKRRKRVKVSTWTTNLQGFQKFHDKVNSVVGDLTLLQFTFTYFILFYYIYILRF